MPEIVPSIEADLIVALDYGQFYLHTGAPDHDALPDLVSAALDGTGIAQRGPTVVVMSPHQNNFRMPFRLEVWPVRPPDDLDAWEEAFAAHIDVGEAGLRYESPTLDVVDLPVPPGAYRAVIAGRGFVGDGWAGSTEPGDEWRLQLHLDGDPADPVRLRGWSFEDELSAGS